MPIFGADRTRAPPIGPDEGAARACPGCLCRRVLLGRRGLLLDVPGVVDAISGYTGGMIERPTYEQVCSGHTGHAEAVLVTFDPTVVSYEKLLEAFWRHHDPTTPNRQGPDHGTQYRSGVFFHPRARAT